MVIAAMSTICVQNTSVATAAYLETRSVFLQAPTLDGLQTRSLKRVVSMSRHLVCSGHLISARSCHFQAARRPDNTTEALTPSQCTLKSLDAGPSAAAQNHSSPVDSSFLAAAYASAQPMPPGARNLLVADPNICFQWLPGDLQRHKHHAFVLYAPWHGLNACVLSCHARAYTSLGWVTNWSLPHVKGWASW